MKNKDKIFATISFVCITNYVIFNGNFTNSIPFIFIINLYLNINYCINSEKLLLRRFSRFMYLGMVAMSIKLCTDMYYGSIPKLSILALINIITLLILNFTSVFLTDRRYCACKYEPIALMLDCPCCQKPYLHPQ